MNTHQATRREPFYGRTFTMVVLTLFYACTNLSTAEDRYAALEGARVHYQNFGQGSEAIVFIHGYACNATFWHSQLPAFRRSGHVIALDLPGHGESDMPAVSYTQEYLARGVAAVLNDAGVRRAYVVAHSMGMSVARYFLDKHPETVAALVNVDSRSLFYGEDVDTGEWSGSVSLNRFAARMAAKLCGNALDDSLYRKLHPACGRKSWPRCPVPHPMWLRAPTTVSTEPDAGLMNRPHFRLWRSMRSPSRPRLKPCFAAFSQNFNIKSGTASAISS